MRKQTKSAFYDWIEAQPKPVYSELPPGAFTSQSMRHDLGITDYTARKMINKGIAAGRIEQIGSLSGHGGPRVYRKIKA